jgi:hypothetical protein
VICYQVVQSKPHKIGALRCPVGWEHVAVCSCVLHAGVIGQGTITRREDTNGLVMKLGQKGYTALPSLMGNDNDG